MNFTRYFACTNVLNKFTSMLGMGLLFLQSGIFCYFLGYLVSVLTLGEEHVKGGKAGPAAADPSSSVPVSRRKYTSDFEFHTCQFS